MVKQVVIRIEEGSFESGFPVSLEFWEDRRVIAREKCRPLPPNPDFPRVYNEWKNIYAQLGVEVRAIKIPKNQINHVSSLEKCKEATETLESSVKNWLEQPTFGAITGKILGRLKNGTPNKSVRVIIDTSNDYLRKLSWDSWDLFQKKGFLPQAEFTLLSQYFQDNPPTEILERPINILAIFGSDGKLQLDKDREQIKNLERDGINIDFIPKTKDPLTYEDLYDTLWQGNWDIIFYSGHSSAGTIQIGDGLNIPINALREPLKKAASRVKLAIFNSCDGLGIAEYLADFGIPHLVAMREYVPDLVARRFLQFFLDEFTQGQPLHTSVREARRHLERLEFPLPNKLFYPRASKLPVLIQNPTTPELYWPGGGIPLIRQIIDILRKGSKILTRSFPNRHFRRGIILFLLTIIVIVGISRLPEPEVKGDNISIGEEILVKLSPPRDKQRGVDAVAKCQEPWNYFLPIWKSHIREEWSDCFVTKKNYREAAKYLQESWKTERRDPETLIYLNNALLEATGVDPDTIAVVVPVLQNETGQVSNAELAEEILRGVAQAQTEVNLSLFNENVDSKVNLSLFNENVDSKVNLPGANFPDSKSLNGKGLKVIIANDANNEGQAKKVANTIVKRSKIRGVLGSWTSDMTMATVDIYNRNQLVMVSPGAATSELTKDPRRFFFRVNTNNYVHTVAPIDVLMSDRVNQKRVAIFYNPESPYSSDYKKRFEEKFLEEVGTKKDIVGSFDISSDFNAESAIQKIRNSGELAIVLIPDAQVSDAIDNALEIIKENDGQNWIIGNWSVYSPKTLNIAEPQLVEKLIVTVPWHPLINPKSYFSESSEQLWGGPVSGRTALSYDATQVLIKGIEENGKKHRREIQKTLAGKDFQVEGVTGKIKFQPGTGDRQKLPFKLVTVVRCPKNKEYGFAFIPVGYQDVESICSVPD
ncbi:MAG: ABC transporter substrate-binding protein [Okeania sp. SIO3C4]|nr:ABC transporter substrate-binding protein [Okeania sp. SIO3C4]